MPVASCIPVVPSMDVERSLRLWRDGLGFSETWWEARREGTLVGVGVRKDHMTFMLNIRAGTPDKPEDYEGVRFYWAPDDLHGLRERLAAPIAKRRDLCVDKGRGRFRVICHDAPSG